MKRTGAAAPRSRARLRASPNFALTFGIDGRPYVARETEPYTQYWLSERERILLSLFSRRGGATPAEACEGYYRLTGRKPDAALTRRLAKVVDEMHAAGVIVGATDDVSRYGTDIVRHYIEHRPFPKGLLDHVVKAGAVGKESRVLDLAGGPGDLAIGLAHVSGSVSLMELSRAFLRAASRRAAEQDVKLLPVHDSCNRLVFRSETYDVITISQALHWLDDVLVCRGICRALEPGGSFFVIHSAIRIDDAHPLAPILGYDSILGRKKRRPFSEEVEPLVRRLALLFEALDAPDVERLDMSQRWEGDDAGGRQRIVPVDVSLFRQRRPFDLGYVRGFLTPQHVAPTGLSLEAVLADLEARCRSATPGQLLGWHDWAVLQFRRGGRKVPLQKLAPDRRRTVSLAW